MKGDAKGSGTRGRTHDRNRFTDLVKVHSVGPSSVFFPRENDTWFTSGGTVEVNGD